MKLFTILFASISLFSFGQTVHLSGGVNVTELDWRFVYFNGSEEAFYTGNVTNNLSANLGVEYFQNDLYSLTTYVGFFQSGGQIASDEEHPGWIIDETENRANNLTVGTDLNIIPINNKLQLMLSFGPRLDYLMPFDNSNMEFYTDDLREVYFGLSAGVGVFYQLNNLKVGVRSSYLHRFASYIDVAPDYGNGFEPPKLGVRAKDRFMINNQLVIGYNLGK